MGSGWVWVNMAYAVLRELLLRTDLDVANLQTSSSSPPDGRVASDLLA
jgi:hypothetical protein